tara:strand:+ start:382 stop:540 length:159 start_codon:yes stop_codon:yes gene_type:complete
MDLLAFEEAGMTMKAEKDWEDTVAIAYQELKGNKSLRNDLKEQYGHEKSFNS